MTRSVSLWLSLCLCSLAMGGCRDRIFDNPSDPDREPTPYEVVATHNVAGLQPLDLTFSGDLLWAVNADGGLWGINTHSGEVVRRLSPNRPSDAAAYDGANLWLAERGTSRLVLISVINGMETMSLNLARAQARALDYMPERIYLADSLTNHILEIDPATGATLASVQQPAFSIAGMAVTNTGFWILDNAQGKIFRLDRHGQTLDTYLAPARDCAGLTLITGYLWVGDRNGKLYKLLMPNP